MAKRVNGKSPAIRESPARVRAHSMPPLVTAKVTTAKAMALAPVSSGTSDQLHVKKHHRMLANNIRPNPPFRQQNSLLVSSRYMNKQARTSHRVSVLNTELT